VIPWFMCVASGRAKGSSAPTARPLLALDAAIGGDSLERELCGAESRRMAA